MPAEVLNPRSTWKDGAAYDTEAMQNFTRIFLAKTAHLTIYASWTILTGWLKQKTGGYDAPMQAIWFFLLLGIAAYVFLVREKYAPKESVP